MNNYKMTVGLEVHAELKTKTKIFCTCKNSFGEEANSSVCPICLGLPGALPSLNREAVTLAIKAGLATSCNIRRETRLDRKNYFYPDLPKAYQISQYDRPLCHDGYIEIDTPEGGCKRIGIERIHIEEDAGKLLHSNDGRTLIDYNRCGVPLIEIVSKPCIHSSEEAKEYLRELRSILLYCGISDCKMNEGSMRCDVNISVAPIGADSLGQKVEIKNINSVVFAAKAIEAEFERQCQMLEAGEKILPQTRRYNEARGKTDLMRTKETAEDYRFFPEPDLMPLAISAEEIKEIRASLPALPREKREMYERELLLSSYDSALICSDPSLSAFFDRVCAKTKYKKLLANLLLGEGLKLCRAESFSCPVSEEYAGELVTLWGEEEITASCAKKLFGRFWHNGESGIFEGTPAEIVKREELGQIRGEKELEKLAREAIEKNEKAVSDFKSGKEKAFNTIKGGMMSASGGRANPKLAEEILYRLLREQ